MASPDFVTLPDSPDLLSLKSRFLMEQPMAEQPVDDPLMAEQPADRTCCLNIPAGDRRGSAK
jgi:hypothetical protein